MLADSTGFARPPPDFAQIANRPGQRQSTKSNDFTSAFHKIPFYSGAENEYLSLRNSTKDSLYVSTTPAVPLRETTLPSSHSIPADTLGYYYGYDTLNRRNLITREDGSFWDIGYNTRSEVTAAKQRRGAGSSNYLPGRQFTYAYDNLGNRTTAKSGGVTSGSEASLRTTTTYAAANALNQYSLITNPSTFDVTGISLTPANYNPSDSATEPVAVKVGTGAQLKATTRNPSTASTYARWHRESTSTVTTGSQARVDSVTVYENGTVKNTGKMSLPAPSQSLAYDLDGNLTDDGVWLYTWDGENRLKSMEHKDYGGSASKLYYKLTFDYDSQSRRIRKQVQTKTTFGGAWGGATSHLFVYDDSNLLLWVNGSVAKQGYHWLPDMSGTWQGAGGVRGLVGISYKDQGGAAYYWSLNVGYDGNGNVVGLYGDVGGSTGLYAVYEYDPFGNTIRQNVTPAGNSLAATLGENPFRFSTKFTDDESKLIYYGFRYYSAVLGRWLNRDPRDELGFIQMFRIMSFTKLSIYSSINSNSQLDNNLISNIDILGLMGCKTACGVQGLLRAAVAMACGLVGVAGCAMLGPFAPFCEAAVVNAVRITLVKIAYDTMKCMDKCKCDKDEYEYHLKPPTYTAPVWL